MKHEWKLNTSTGTHIQKLTENSQVIRWQHGTIYLYCLEFWGDYGPSFPKRGGWHTTFKQATSELGTLSA